MQHSIVSKTLCYLPFVQCHYTNYAGSCKWHCTVIKLCKRLVSGNEFGFVCYKGLLLGLIFYVHVF